MDVLDSVDVNLVFNHYMSCSIGFLTSLAVLTAVVSFWKLRSFSIPPPTTEKSTSAAASQVLPPPSGLVATEKSSQLPLNIDKQVPTVMNSCSLIVSAFGTIIEEEHEEEDADMSSTTASPRKFTVMYYGDVCNGDDETTLFHYCKDVVHYDENSTATVEASPFLRTRKGNNDLGWYRHQDLSMLNGNVVKLWDCKKQQTYSRASVASSSISTGIRS